MTVLESQPTPTANNHHPGSAETKHHEYTSTPGGEPASAPCDLRQYVHLAINGRPEHLANMSTNALLSERPNDCDMATELVPKEIENDLWAYVIVYQMESHETVEMTSKWWSLKSHSDGYHCQRTSHGDQEDYREPYCTKPQTKTLTEWYTEQS